MHRRLNGAMLHQTTFMTPAPPQSLGSACLLAHQERIPPLLRELESYQLRFARTAADLEAVRRLRFRVFNVELGEGLPQSYRTGLDADPYDVQCQHLMVIERASGRCIGTYRMQTWECAREGRGFSSAVEFALEDLPLTLRIDAVELGRACIEEPHRNRRVLFLLWQGLVEYARFHGKHHMFGCSSLTSQEPAAGLRLHQQLAADGHVDPRVQLRVRPGHSCEATPSAILAQGKIEVPRLFRAYLRHGARIIGAPAIDREFGTIDFLTLVALTEEHRQRFGLESPA